MSHLWAKSTKIKLQGFNIHPSSDFISHGGMFIEYINGRGDFSKAGHMVLSAKLAREFAQQLIDAADELDGDG